MTVTDPHASCAAEIARLKARVSELEERVEWYRVRYHPEAARHTDALRAAKVMEGK